MTLSRLLIVALFALSVATASARVAPLLAPNPSAEQHMLALTRNLRCLVCQDQSLAESQAGLARDLRAQVLQMIEAGRSDKQIVGYLVARYGNFVRYDPPFDRETLVLWIGPLVLLLAGIAALLRSLRARKAATQLDAEQRQRAREWLSDHGESV